MATGLGEAFTLITLTRGDGCSAWRQLTAEWNWGRRWPYFELEGLSDVSQARSAAASFWLQNHDTPWCVWLDDDMVVPLAGLELFLQSALDHQQKADLVCAAYTIKRPNSGTMALLFRDDNVALGLGGGLVPVIGCGFGCVAVKREVFERVALNLPRVRYDQAGCVGWPFFLGMVTESPGDPDGAKRHCGEDFAFCYRANAAGCRLFCDTRLRIGHRGAYTYHWEDAGAEVEHVDRIDLGRVRKTPMKLEPDK